jgi:hypothetical protein
MLSKLAPYMLTIYLSKIMKKARSFFATALRRSIMFVNFRNIGGVSLSLQRYKKQEPAKGGKTSIKIKQRKMRVLKRFDRQPHWPIHLSSWTRAADLR